MKFVILKMTECSTKLSIDPALSWSSAEQMCTCDGRWRRRRGGGWWQSLLFRFAFLFHFLTFSWCLSVVHYIKSIMRVELKTERPATWKQLNRNFLSSAKFSSNGNKTSMSLSKTVSVGNAVNLAQQPMAACFKSVFFSGDKHKEMESRFQGKNTEWMLF